MTDFDTQEAIQAEAAAEAKASRWNDRQRERQFNELRDTDRALTTMPGVMPGFSLMAPQLLRAAIFATCARKATSRQVLPLHDDITDTRGGSVEYRGAPLTQAHLRVLLGVLAAAQNKRPHYGLTLHATDFLAAIGKDTSSRSVEALRDQLTDLRSATFAVKEHARDRGHVFDFIDEVVWEGRTIALRLSNAVPKMFHDLGKTFVSVEQRKALADGLQTALADILASTSAESFDIDALAKLLHRDDVAQVGKDVRAALDKLKAVGLLTAWSATRGRVHVVRA